MASTGSGHFTVYSSTVCPSPTVPADDRESIYLSVGQRQQAGPIVYSDFSSEDTDEDVATETETGLTATDDPTKEGDVEKKQQESSADSDDDDDEDDEDEDEEEEDYDDDENEEDYDDTDSCSSSSWTDGFSNYLTTESASDFDEDSDSQPYHRCNQPFLHGTGAASPSSGSAPPARPVKQSILGERKDELYLPRATMDKVAREDSGRATPTADAEGSSYDMEGPGYRPSSADAQAKQKESGYLTMTSSYVPIDGTTGEVGPVKDVQAVALECDPLKEVSEMTLNQEDLRKKHQLERTTSAYLQRKSWDPLNIDADDSASMSLLEMMDDREVKRRMMNVLSSLPLRERSFLLRQFITSPTDDEMKDWSVNQAGDVAARPSMQALKGRRPPPLLKKQQSSSSFFQLFNKDNPSRFYASHQHGAPKGVTLHKHDLAMSQVAMADAISHKKAQDEEAERKKRKEELEAKLEEAFRAATEGKPKQDPATERKLKRDLRKLLMRRRSSGLKKKHLTFDRKWNEEYQSLLDKGIWNMSPSEAQEVSNLMHDFVFNVETYAKVIINELNVDVSKKTIKPVEVGGIAGGQKYVVQGILFKFCKDPKLSKKPAIWLYGGDKPRDDYAMKAAGLELQGLSLLATPLLIQTLRHPLMALIDYKGFRMVAMCLLPLDETSLRYGSDDGGKTVVASDPVLNKTMERVGRLFNLKKHTVGKERVPLIGPGDIEGHLGTDGRYYLLDYARLMPPEAPRTSPGEECSDRSVFYKMLRPEMVKKFSVPLSSDAFTGWSKYDTDIEQSERDIREATRQMLEEVIPALAKDLDKMDISDFFERVLKDDTCLQRGNSDEESNKADLNSFEKQETDVDYLLIKVTKHTNTVFEMHRRGINMRHIGRLRKLVKNKYWRIMLLCEAMSRCIKHQIRLKMRKAVLRSNGVSSESSCKDLVLRHVNIFFGSGRESEKFWKMKIKRVSAKKFPGLLTPQERKPTFDLRKSLSLRLVFLLTERWSILRLNERIKRELFTKNIYDVRVLPGDVEEIMASVRTFPLIHAIDASLYLMEALNPECDNDESLRLLRSANDHLTAALDDKPQVAHMLWSLGRVEAEAARRKPFDQDAEQLFERSILSHQQALEIEQTAGTFNSLALSVEAYADKLEEALEREKELQRRAVELAQQRAEKSEEEAKESEEPKRMWTDEEIAEKEEKLATLRRQAAEYRAKALQLENESQSEEIAPVLRFCAEHLDM